jgi:prepilin peptidase CpaA
LSILVTEAANFMGAQGGLVLPLILSVWIAWGDIRTRRIPNYLTLATALTGLAYGLTFHGWAGLGDGLLGLGLGFGFLLIPYILGGMGAGDVKALAALGAWVGMERTFYLICYMGLAGGLLTLGLLWWKGLLWQKLRQAWVGLLNWVLCRPDKTKPASPPSQLTPGIPYGVALALGMAGLLVIHG